MWSYSSPSTPYPPSCITASLPYSLSATIPRHGEPGLQLSSESLVTQTTQSPKPTSQSLYNTLGKIISATMTNVLVYITMHHNLLLPKCFGRLLGHTTTNLLLYLTHDIKNVWRQKNVVTIILLDIATLFPNAVTSQLILNMKRLGYPTPLVNFFRAMLEDCCMTLSFDGLTSGEIDIDNGIGQGDPSSMILYLIYSHALVAMPTQEHGVGGAYIDDNFFTAQGD